MGVSDPSVPLLSLLQLQRRARQAATPEALGFVAVNETLQLLRYRQAALWRAGTVARVAAVSGLPQPDPTAPYVQWLGAMCRHLAREHADRSEPLELQAADVPAAMQAEWSEWLPAQALWLPLGREGQPPEGALLLAREDAWTPHELALLKELAHAYGHALAAFRPQRAWPQRWLGTLRGGKGRRRWLLLALAACLFPVRITALAPAEVMPRDGFMVRAPLDGVIDRFEVQPNQPVRPGTPLFSLDTTALRARLELAHKALDTAREEFRQSAQAAVTSDKSRAEMALRRGKLQEKAVERDYTAEQLDRVQVKADRAGIAVFADANDWIGRAVSLGERVLLVADPAQVELVAWLPASELLPVAPGDTLTLYPQGAPLRSYEAQVSSVAYRAELAREGFLAYRIKAQFPAGQAVPRIGQLGTARLQAGWGPLLYVALRRPLAAVRQWLGW